MKKVLSILFVLLFITIRAQSNGPKIYLNETEYDFGDIYQGQIVNHSFVIKNSGKGVLKIDKVKASCGCTAANAGKNELAAGESTEIDVKFNSANRKGKQKKYVYISSNDEKNPEVRLAFTANIIVKGSEEAKNMKAPVLDLSLNYHDFGHVQEGKILELNIPLKNTGNDILEVKDVKTSCGCTAALLSSKKLQPGETGNLKIEFDTSGRSGETTRTITIYSNDPTSAQQVITISANIEKRDS